MEYEPIRFQGVPNYGVRVERPAGHLYIAVLDLTDRPRDRRLPDSPQFDELTAYLCGAGVGGFVYDLRGYTPPDAAERATGIAINMKRFHILERYVGLDMSKVQREGGGLIDCWRQHLTIRSLGSVGAAVEDLIAEKEAGRLPF